jgi:hypothetical protein
MIFVNFESNVVFLSLSFFTYKVGK